MKCEAYMGYRQNKIIHCKREATHHEHYTREQRHYCWQHHKIARSRYPDLSGVPQENLIHATYELRLP